MLVLFVICHRPLAHQVEHVLLENNGDIHENVCFYQTCHYAILVLILKLDTDVSLPNYLFWGSHKAYSFHIFGQGPCTFFILYNLGQKKVDKYVVLDIMIIKHLYWKHEFQFIWWKRSTCETHFPPLPSHQAMLYICKKKVRDAVFLNIAWWGWGMCGGGSWKVKSIVSFSYALFFHFKYAIK